MKTEIQIKQPSECTERELKEFEQVVLSGGQVDPVGLLNRIKNCLFLAFCYSMEQKVIGVSAIKQKSKAVVANILSKAQFSKTEIPTLELGYSVTRKEFRKNGINKSLNDQLLERIQNENVFATTDNNSMRKYLLSRGFKKRGESFEGRYNENLDYFER